MQDSTFKYDVFLSHSSKDKPVVRELAERLRDDGIRVWLDEWELQPGDPESIKIEEGLQHARVLILCMSKNAFDSEWVSLERHTMMFRDPSNKGRRFIPLLLADCEIPLLLKQYAYLDWKDRSKIVYQKLLGSLVASEKEDVPEAKLDTLLATLEGHTNAVYGCTISPDGKKIVSSSEDKTIKIWDVEAGKNLATLEGHSEIVVGCAISYDGKK